MNLFKSLFFVLFTAAAASAAQAQTAAVTAGPTRVAVIDSRQFSDPKGGINRFIKAYASLEAEFKPKSDELKAMSAKHLQLDKDLSALRTSSAPVNPSTLQAKYDEIENLKRQIKYKQEDAEAAYQKRYDAVIGPLSEDVFTALEAYAKQQRVDVLIDLSKFDGSIVVMNSAVDITQVFIKDYNSRNP